MNEALKRASKIKLFIMDVDGVMTDGRIFITSTGEELKSFHTLDGLGLKMLQKTGVKLAIITGRDAPCVALRAKNLNIDHYFAGISDKQKIYQHLLNEMQLSDEQCAYIGDDIVDLPVMLHVGFAVAVNEAHQLVKEKAHYVTHASAGKGAVREACEFILEAQGNLSNALAEYIK